MVVGGQCGSAEGDFRFLEKISFWRKGKELEDIGLDEFSLYREYDFVGVDFCWVFGEVCGYGVGQDWKSRQRCGFQQGFFF